VAQFGENFILSPSFRLNPYAVSISVCNQSASFSAPYSPAIKSIALLGLFRLIARAWAMSSARLSHLLSANMPFLVPLVVSNPGVIVVVSVKLTALSAVNFTPLNNWLYNTSRFCSSKNATAILVYNLLKNWSWYPQYMLYFQ